MGQPANLLMKQEDIESNWRVRGFSCELWIDPPGQRWEDFIHKVDELVIVLRGKVEFEIDGRIFHPACHEELLIPAGTLHSVRNIGQGFAKWLYGYRRMDKNEG